jgi:uncharacterized damage-inducible protein DinB
MANVLSPAELLEILEGNRRLTVRTVQAFTEQDLFHYTPVEAMRPFAELVKEILGIELGYVRGIATGEWVWNPDEFQTVTTAADLLVACEAVRRQTLELWPAVTAERLAVVEQDPFFGGPQSHFARLQYALENEVHHRGQGFVYLRLLGAEVPMFWER